MGGYDLSESSEKLHVGTAATVRGKLCLHSDMTVFRSVKLSVYVHVVLKSRSRTLDSLKVPYPKDNIQLLQNLFPPRLWRVFFIK